jgi:GNAT superfamily N-acetyltransferase
MKLTMRPYHGEDDYWRIRAFLREVLLLNNLRIHSWEVPRLDYWRWHCIANCGYGPPVEQVTYLWETPGGEIAAVLNPEALGEAFLQIDPRWRTPELEEEMIDLAEQQLAVTTSEARRELAVWAHQGDTLREDILTRRGYRQGDRPEYQRIRCLNGSIPDMPIPPGYTIRSLGGADELPARSWASWRGFHPNEPDENYQGWEWYPNVQRCPLYRRDLDIVAEAPGGEIAAFCTMWYDDVTRVGMFEPVATVPEHQQRGLGKAVMFEAMRRVQRLGATHVTVGGFSPAANALYAATVSPEYELFYWWEKTL